MHEKSLNVLIAGCGYVGCQLAQAELVVGNQVSVLVRSRNKQRALPNGYAGLQVMSWDLDEPQGSLPPLQAGKPDLIYYFVPPTPAGNSDRRVSCFLDAVGEPEVPPKVVLISTTSVYGDCAGEQVDENRPANPASNRAKRRLSAEKQWQDWCDSYNAALTILRVAGIYGAGKLPLERLRSGDPVLLLEDSPWSNRIYAKDLVRVCLAAGHTDTVGVYNAVDGNPSTMTDYFLKVSDAAGITRPPQIPMHEAENLLSAGMLSYLRESKRLSNQRLLRDFGEDIIRFPTLDHGLADIFSLNPGTGSD